MPHTASSSAAPARERGRKVIFVSYGDFDSASGGHIAHFANGLVRMGHKVGVVGFDRILNVYAFGDPLFEFFRIADLLQSTDEILAFDGSFDPADTILFGWTTREVVRRTIEAISARYGLKYIVHLEDNEAHLAQRFTELTGSATLPDQLSDMTKFQPFLSASSGVTIITERLREMVPAPVPTLLLEPGVEADLFGTPLPSLRKATIKKVLDISPGSKLVVYPGDVHLANGSEVAALYAAIQLLRARGTDITLVRTGNGLPPGIAADEPGTRSLGIVDRPFLVSLLKCADVLVQPGRPGPFNDYRLPSKVPEFLALGKPVILPRTNIGLKLRHTVDAVLLEAGTAEEIVEAIDLVLSNPELAARLSTNAKAYAAEHLQWKRQSERLGDFIETALGGVPPRAPRIVT